MLTVIFNLPGARLIGIRVEFVDRNHSSDVGRGCLGQLLDVVRVVAHAKTGG